MTDRDRRGSTTSRSSSREGKGKAVTRRDELDSVDEQDTDEANDDGKGPIVVFSCRHMFHQVCLEKMQDADAVAAVGEETPGRPGPDLICPLCT